MRALLSAIPDQSRLRRFASKIFQHFQDCLAVKDRFWVADVRQRKCVRSQFALRTHLGEGQPHHRIEPVDNLQNRDKPVDFQIAPLDMREFVQKDVPEFIPTKSVRKPPLEAEALCSINSHSGRTFDFFGFNHSHPLLYSENFRTVPDELFDPDVGDRNTSGEA